MGLEVSSVRFLAVTNDVFDTIGKHYITLWMTGDCPSGEPRIAAAYEVAEWDWYPLDTLPAPLFLPLDNLLAGRSYPSRAAAAELI